MLVPLALVELFFNHVITGSGLPVALHVKDAISNFSSLYTRMFCGCKVIEGPARQIDKQIEIVSIILSKFRCTSVANVPYVAQRKVKIYGSG